MHNLPSFQLNDLFQYKKPQYISRPNGIEWDEWKQGYFRYLIYEKQQKILNMVAQKFKRKIVVLYASPAFYTMNDLIQNYLNGKIVDKSNFTKAEDICFHKCNTYIEDGITSKAFSKMVEIKSFEFKRLLTEDIDFGYRDNEWFLKNTAKKLEEVILGDESYGMAFLHLVRLLNDNIIGNCFRDFFVINLFCLITGTRLWVKCLKRENE